MRASLRTVVIVTTALAGGAATVGAADLQEGWAVLSEASTDGYYRDTVHATPVIARAVAKLPQLAKGNRPRQKAAAEALIEAIGKKAVADFEAAQSVGKLKTDTRAAHAKLLIEGAIAMAPELADTGARAFGGRGGSPTVSVDLTPLVADAMFSIGGSASRMAQAQVEAAAARTKVRAAWEEMVFPPIRNRDAGEAPARLLKGEVTATGSVHEVWTAFHNVSGKTLTNVAVIFKPLERKKDLRTQYYFVRNWPPGVVIRPDPFRTAWVIKPGLPDFKPDPDYGGTYEVWADQGHTGPAPVRSVGFYAYRAGFLETVVREGASYLHVSDDAQFLLEFTRVTKDGQARVVEATFVRTRAKAGEKPEAVRLRGRWDTEVDYKDREKEQVGLRLTLAPADAKAKEPSIVFVWDRPNYTVELGPEKKFRVVPLLDDKAKK